jgi:flagellar basal body rod protein FlgB
MLESIDQFTDYDIIYPHREDLYELDPFTFLYNLANVETNNYRSKKYEYNQEYRQKLIDWFFEEKQKESVNLFYKNRLHLRFNSKFFDTIALKLHNENLNLNN